MFYPNVERREFDAYRREVESLQLARDQLSVGESQVRMAATQSVLAAQQVGMLASVQQTLAAALRELQAVRHLEAGQLDALQTATRLHEVQVKRELLQDRIEEFVYNWGKMLQSFRDDASPVPPATQYLMLGGLFTELGREGITTASVKGFEGKAKFDACVQESVQLHRRLAGMPEVQEALAHATRADRERAEQERRRQEDEAAEKRRAAESMAAERRRMIELRDRLVAERTRILSLPVAKPVQPGPRPYRPWRATPPEVRNPAGPSARLAAHTLAVELGLYDVIDGRLGFESAWLEKAVRHVLDVLHPTHGVGGMLMWSMVEVICDKVLANSKAGNGGQIDWNDPLVKLAKSPLDLARYLKSQWGHFHSKAAIEGTYADQTREENDRAIEERSERYLRAKMQE